MDGGPWRPVGTNLTLTLADGDRTVRVRADDVAGNREIATAEFQLDTNPLSPSGPSGSLPILALVVGESGTGLVATLVWMRRRKRFP